MARFVAILKHPLDLDEPTPLRQLRACAMVSWPCAIWRPASDTYSIDVTGAESVSDSLDEPVPD
jgi:hypothetical protein